MEWPPLDAAAIVASAREYVGTPWHLDARLKGIGIDCFGLIVGALNDLGAGVEDVRGYTGGDDWLKLLNAVEPFTFFVPVHGARPREVSDLPLIPGDLLLFRNTDLPPPLRVLCHCGFYTGEGGIIHAWNAPAIDAVAEHPIDAYWMRSLAVILRYRGVRA